ncbi:MAG: OsmC family protein [Gemmatimonadaceae bacterium]
MQKSIAYATHLTWDGNRATGTRDYASYGREYHISVAGKPDFLGSAALEFRGDPSRYDPEDLLVAAVSACHMLAYLALCARRGIRVVAYEDAAFGELLLDSAAGGAFSEVTLRPHVTIAHAAHEQVALELHREAHARCFIANSCRMPVTHKPTIFVAAAMANGRAS